MPILVTVAVFGASVICLEVHQFLDGRLQAPKDTRRFLVLARSLKPGEAIQLQDLSLVRRSELRSPLLPGAYTDQELHLVKGVRVRCSLPSGSLLSPRCLDLEPIPPKPPPVEEIEMWED